MYFSAGTYKMPSWPIIHGTSTWNPYPSINLPHRQMEYKPVTAYTAVQPVLVNGVDINTGPYPILNFQPEGASVPYIYVPIAQFSKVGAKVEWNEIVEELQVLTDYYINKTLLAVYQSKMDMLAAGQLPAFEKGPSLEMEDISYDGKIEEIGMHIVGGILSNLISDEETVALTSGKSYKGFIDAPEPGTQPPRVSWIMFLDDNGNTVTFSTTRA